MDQQITIGMVVWASAAVAGIVVVGGFCLLVLFALADGFKR